MSDSLSCENLSKSFGGVQALRGIDLQITGAEILGVIGPNGSGKSTLFNILSGELKPSGGRVMWRGQRLDGIPPHRVARSGIVRTFQSASVFPELSVRESLDFARWTARKHLPRTTAEVAEMTGLAGVLDQPCRALAYGHQKLLGVALGVLTAPSLLLLDEPAAGLNQVEVRRFLDLIRTLHTELKIGIGLIDHDMGLVMAACQRIAVLNFGTLIAIGTPAEIRRNDEVLSVYLSGDLRDAPDR